MLEAIHAKQGSEPLVCGGDLTASVDDEGRIADPVGLADPEFNELVAYLKGLAP